MGCVKLENIQIPNPQLKRLHLVRCIKLRNLKVDALNLCEFYITGWEEPEVLGSTANLGLRFELNQMVVSRADHWIGMLEKMLEYNLRIEDDLLASAILDSFIDWIL